MTPQNSFFDILRKESVRIILERLQGSIIDKMDSFSIDEPANEKIEEQLDNAYVNRKGVPLAMDVFKPKVNPNTELPVIIVIHGGGLVAGDRRISRKLSRTLAEKGYLVFSIEYRLAPRANVCEQLDDVCAGMDLIGKKLVDFNVDFTRIFLVSESAGAYLATYVAAMKNSTKLQNAIGYQPTRMSFKALGLFSGMFYTNRQDPIGLLLSEQFYGEKGNDGTFLQYTNPEHPEIVQNLPPTFFVTSRGDFLNRYTLDYHKALKKAGNDTHLLYYGSKELIHAFPTLSPDREETTEVIDKMLAWFENQTTKAERKRKMNKSEIKKNNMVTERIESGEITNQKMWKFVKEINSVSEERLDATAMISGGREYTYRQMFRLWDRYAEVFSALKINEKNKSRVAIIGNSCAELIASIYALNMTGTSISVVPTMEMFFMDRFEQLLLTEKITDLIICSTLARPEVMKLLLANKEKFGLRNIIVIRETEKGLPNGSMEKMVIRMAYQQIRNMPGILFMHKLLEKYEATPITYASSESKEAAIIVHTSGTTKGIHKPIPHSDKAVNIAVTSFLTNPLFSQFSGKRTIAAADIAGAYMLIDQIHLPLAMGCPIVFVQLLGSPYHSAKILEQNKIAILFTSPMWFNYVVAMPSPKNLDLSCLEYVVLGGASVSADAKKRYNEFLQAHGADIKCANGYGLSEICGACIVAPPEFEDGRIGYPLSHIKAKIFDEQEKKFYDLADGPRTGVLYLNSPCVSSGKIDDTVYFELEDVDGEEYLCTYDLVTVNDDGSLTCCGRANRYFVNNEGIRFDAGIVETSIGEQEGIGACAIVPVYDKTLHDTLPALYIQTITAGPLSEKTVKQALCNVFIKDGKTAETNLPTQCVIVDKLPMTNTGKVSIYDIQKNGVSSGRYFRVDAIRVKDALVDIKLVPVSGHEAFGSHGVPEELQKDLESLMGGLGKLGLNSNPASPADAAEGQQMPQGFGYQQMPNFKPQGFGYQPMAEGQQMPQGFGYQQMPNFKPQGFGYQPMAEGQQAPQGFGYQQMPNFMTQGFGYQPMAEGQQMPQGFGYQQMPNFKPQGFGYQQMPNFKPQGFGYQPMAEGQQAPQGFGYQQMPNFKPQGFGYQPMTEGQQMPQGFGYQQMPNFKPQGFGYQPMTEGQQMPQGFGYQQMPNFQPQGFGYQPAAEGQQAPQGFGYQQMPNFKPQGFGYQPMAEGQQAPQGFGYQPMAEGQQMPQGFGYQPGSADAANGAQPFNGGMPAMMGQLMNILGFFFKNSQNDYDYED